MKTMGRNWSDPANADLVYELYYRRHESPEKRGRSPRCWRQSCDPVNANFDHRGRVLVDKVNNVRIESSRTLSGF